LLAAEKKNNESFRRAIKRRMRSRRTAAKLLRNLDEIALVDETLDKVEKLATDRTGFPGKLEVLNSRLDR